MWSFDLRQQRIYVHESVYDAFISKFVDIAKVSPEFRLPTVYIILFLQRYRLGDPTRSETNLGPVVSLASAQRIRKQVHDAGQ